MGYAISRFKPLNDDTAQRLNWKVASMLFTGLGLVGSERVVGPDGVHVGKYWIFHALTNCTVASITYSTNAPGAVVVGDVIVAGDRIYGEIRTFALTSGTGELYLASAL
jgi:hypothetical protein